MLSKRYESTEVDRRTWLHVPSGTHWSTSSDLMSLQHDFVWDTFSDAMLYFLFRVKRSYRVRQGSLRRKI